MSGSDTIMINTRILADLAEGDCVKLTYPNEIASVKTGKNGNSIYGFNATGANAEVELRVVRGSSDDKFLNGLLAQQNGNFAGFVLLAGEFIKQMGDGTGKILNDTHALSGGIFTKAIEAKSNVEGDTEQSLSVYHMKFSSAQRTLT
jgi:hypothetical protein